MNAVNRMKTAESDLARKEDAMRQKLEQNEQELLKKKAETEEDIRRQREANEQDLTRMRDRMKADARAEADRIVSEAQLSKENLRDQLMRETAGKAVDYAGELFKLVIGKTVTEKLNIAFIDELVTALEEVDGTSVHVEANQAEFIASHKLDPDQKARLEHLLAQKFDISLKIEEKIDPSILAGLIIKLGSLEIDGSLLNRYKEGVEQIKRVV
jgi:F0F1-type ATP synthase delta subunit